MRWLTQGRICLLVVIAAIVSLHVLVLGNELVADDAWFVRVQDSQTLPAFLA